MNRLQTPTSTSRATREGGAAAISAVAPLLALGVVAAPLVAIAMLATLAGAARPNSTSAAIAPPSAAAHADIPAAQLAVYIDAARACDGLAWTVLAAIAKVDSDHGRRDASSTDPTEEFVPSIVGPARDESSATSLPVDIDIGIDTDGGGLDRDAEQDRAVGPMRLQPSAWRALATDGNGDGVADPQNMSDAVATTVRQICPEGSLVVPSTAIARHEQSETDVAAVIEWATRYTGITVQRSAGRYALPLPREAIGNRDRLTQPHHDYPAIDIGVPSGTPVYAITSGRIIAASDDNGRCGGTIILNGDDGATYTYCHLSNVAVTAGTPVDTATWLGATGGQPGTKGAGRSTGPHLHLGILRDGVAMCPQPILLQLFDQSTVRLDQLTTEGCTAL